MSILNKKVQHEKYGEGIIDRFSNGTFHVSYQNKDAMYDYPEDLDEDGCLILLDADAQTMTEVHNDIKVKSGKLLANNINGLKILGLNDNRKFKPISANLDILHQLNHGDCFEETAKDIYVSLCNNPDFNFDLKQSGKFGPQQHLYAQKATSEGYSVWFISYSSYTQDIAKTRGIYNNIEETSSDIVEYWMDDRLFDCGNTIGEKIVTFVKNNFGQYEFWGVLETTNMDAIKKIVRQKYVSETYPEINK